MRLPLLSGLLALLPVALSQDSSSYYQSQQSGFYPAPAMTAPYPAPYGAPQAPPPAPEAQAAPTAPNDRDPSGPGYPFPPTGGAFLGIAPICTKVAIGITRLHSLLEPIKVLLVGSVIFFAIKNYVIPYIIYYARAVEDEDEELLERSGGAPVDRVTLQVLRAVSRGVCMERVACHLGKRAKEFPITKEIVRAIDASGEPEQLLTIFRAAATGDDVSDSCDVYKCDKKRPSKKKYKITTS